MGVWEKQEEARQARATEAEGTWHEVRQNKLIRAGNAEPDVLRHQSWDVKRHDDLQPEVKVAPVAGQAKPVRVKGGGGRQS